MGQDEAGVNIADIRVVGNRRTETEAILAQLLSRKGTPLDPEVVAEDIRRLYSLGFFRDVRVFMEESPQGAILTYQVDEKPAIREVRFEGTDDVSEDDVKEVVDIQPFSILDVASIARNVQKIRDLYLEKGYFLAEITYELAPVSATEVDLTFRINENAKLMVRRITIMGNEKVPSKDIRGVMLTQEGSYISFLTSQGVFREDVFERDAMVISSLYLDRGFINIKVDPPILALSPDRKGVYISINLTEGEQYSIAGIDIQGDLLFPKEELLELVQTESGELFNRTKLFEDINRVADRYKNEGYAYVNVNPLTRTDNRNRQIYLNLDIQQGDKVRFGRVEIQGNMRTRDKVIRRELNIFEGDFYSATAMEESKRNILRLGFFENVEITTNQGANRATLDVIVTVTERQTGSFQAGVGFSSLEQFLGTLQVSEVNLLGRGQTLSLMATLSSIRTYVNLSFIEPRFLDSNWIFSFNLFKYEMAYDQFVRDSLGGDLTLGYHLTDNFNISLTYGYANIDMSRIDTGEELASGANSSVRGAATYDTRDDRLFPNRGQYHNASVEYAPRFLGSDNLFTRYKLQTRFYHPLLWGMVLKTSARYGIVVSHEPVPVPLSERFFVGGIYSVRGFERNSLGPIQRRSGSSPLSPLTRLNEGGNQELVLNFEVEFPIIPQAGGIRGVVFADVGQAYNRSRIILADPSVLFDGDENSDPLRASWGLGFRWFSPMGPLRFEWGFPFNPKDDEKPMVFEFTIGNFL